MKTEKMKKEMQKKDFKLTCGFCKYCEYNNGFRCKKHNLLMLSNDICGQFEYKEQLKN